VPLVIEGFRPEQIEEENQGKLAKWKWPANYYYYYSRLTASFPGQPG